jgi:type IV pilus assembly protein PilV
MYMKSHAPLSRASALLDTRTPQSYSRGFSLIEVMVALVVLSIGLLGIAKLETVALSSTTVANKRSLAAIEAASLAATMHENRGYWSGADPSTATVTITGATTGTTATTTISVGANYAPTLTTSAASVAGGLVCTSTTVYCAAADLAAWDLQQWSKDMVKVLPNYTAVITCGTTTPMTCMVNIKWTETAVAVNIQEVTAASTASALPGFELPSYTLYVQP